MWAAIFPDERIGNLNHRWSPFHSWFRINSPLIILIPPPEMLRSSRYYHLELLLSLGVSSFFFFFLNCAVLVANRPIRLEALRIHAKFEISRERGRLRSLPFSRPPLASSLPRLKILMGSDRFTHSRANDLPFAYKLRGPSYPKTPEIHTSNFFNESKLFQARDWTFPAAKFTKSFVSFNPPPYKPMLNEISKEPSRICLQFVANIEKKKKPEEISREKKKKYPRNYAED